MLPGAIPGGVPAGSMIVVARALAVQSDPQLIASNDKKKNAEARIVRQLNGIPRHESETDDRQAVQYTRPPNGRQEQIWGFVSMQLRTSR